LKYKVKVSYEYPVDAVNAEDALSTLDTAIRLKFANAEGLVEIFEADGKRVLKAVKIEKQQV
jgi:hypothetical protein